MARAPLATVATLAALACGHSEPQPLTERAPPSPRPMTPAPRVAWQSRDIAITGLPAIADDGSSVVIAHRDSDGGRGNPNLTLVEKDRSDRVVRRLAVITANDVDRLDAAEISRRFATAADWLDERHAAKHLVAMTALDAHPPTDQAPASATGAGVIVRWRPSVLRIDLGSGLGSGLGSEPGPGPGPGPGGPGSGRGSVDGASVQIGRTTPPSWLVADRPLCTTCSEICHNEAFLGGGYLDRAHRLAVVVISYRGTDTCWEPGSEAHVVTW